MDFRIDATLPATPARLWEIFFDVRRVATLIPGCEDVVELEPYRAYSAVMRQKIGPFRLEVPARITIDSYETERRVRLAATGTDRFTGTSIDVRMEVDLEPVDGGAAGAQCRLGVAASLQVAGRLASLGYPIVRKRSEELFAEFERRLRAELAGLGAPADAPAVRDGIAPVAAPVAAPTPAPASASASAPAPAPMPMPAPVPVPAADAPRPSPASPSAGPQPRAARSGRVELVLAWPRVGISVAVALAVAHGAVAFGQSPWWWLAAPLLGVAAGLDRRRD